MVTENFFVECVKKGIKGEKITDIPKELDYRQLYNLCIAHSMSVVVFNALENVKEKLSSSFLTALEKSTNYHVMLDVQSEHDINTVLTAFEGNGIKYMPLKGYHLKKIYPSTDMRYASDCDILIDVDEVKSVRKVMAKLGLVSERYDEHHDIYYYPKTKTVFELHKTVFVGKLEDSFGKGNKLFEKAFVKEGYQYFYEMDKELFYISILGHSAYHFAESAGVGIRHLTDIYLYRKTYELNEDYLNLELKKSGLLQFKIEFEKVANYFFEDAIADEFTLKLAEHILKSSLLAYLDLKTASEVASNAQDSNTKGRKKAFWRKVFLPKEQMQFLFPVLKKKIWLTPVFQVVRWFQVLFTRPKAIKKLKEYREVDDKELTYMKEIRCGLGIEFL